MNNIFQKIPKDLPKELIETLSQKEHIKIERIVSRGHASPKEFWYDQPQDEFVILLSGSATIIFDNKGPVNLSKGDYLIIPAKQKHRVEKTDAIEDSIWLAIHY